MARRRAHGTAAGLTADTFPRQSARTERFTLGAPRDVTVAADGSRVAFLRSGGPEDPVTQPLGARPPRRRGALRRGPRASSTRGSTCCRRRSRPGASGRARPPAASPCTPPTPRTSSRSGRWPASSSWPTWPGHGPAAAVPGPVIDPRPDPTGVGSPGSTGGGSGWPSSTTPTGARARRRRRPRGALGHGRVHRRRGDGPRPRVLVAPDGAALLVARVDDGPVPRWWIADPAQPEVAPTEVAYPAAGTANASGHRVGARARRLARRGGLGRRRPGRTSSGAVGRGRPARRARARGTRARSTSAPSTWPPGGTTSLFSDADDAWVERAPAPPPGSATAASSCAPTGRASASSSSRPGGHARRPPGARGLARRARRGPVHGQPGGRRHRRARVALVRRRARADHRGRWGAHRGRRRPHPRRALGRPGPGRRHGDGAHPAGGRPRPIIGRPGHRADGAHWLHRRHPARAAAVAIHHLGAAGSPPRSSSPMATTRPAAAGAARSLRRPPRPAGGQARGATSSQWFADQGFAVVVADGRGTPGRGAAWERAVHRDLASPALEDQVDALAAAAELEPDWTSTGWRSAAGASVATSPRWPCSASRTFPRRHRRRAGHRLAAVRHLYTERYLGHPDADPPSRGCSLLADAPGCTDRCCWSTAWPTTTSWRRTRCSCRPLLAAGRPHQVLPLSGVTHMTPQEDVAENLLLLQLDFLRDALHLA